MHHARCRQVVRFAPLVLLTALLLAPPLAAQSDTTAKAAPKPWYERLAIRGYAQIRYNDLFRSNADLVCPQCDGNIGGPADFSIRRARLAVTAEPTRMITVYINTDLAQTVGDALQFLQVRDFYGDLFVDSAKTFRFRVGISKVPYGWENVQSSQNRLAVDRADPTNSASPGERDLGVMGYWTPPAVHQLFRMLTDSGLKGTGDYGMVGLGVYNGQGGNRAEANDNEHAVARVAYPFRVGDRQIVELDAYGYTGKYVVRGFQRTGSVGGGTEFRDERFGLAAVLYPRPFGLQAEWNWGKGPEYDPATNAIREGDLEGGYVLASYRTRVNGDVMIPYARGQYYDGGKKAELDARHYHVEELEVGVEYSPVPALELTAAYVRSERRTEDGANPDNDQEGNFVRLQLQLNY